MRICFVTDGDLNTYSEKFAESKADVVCFPFRAMGEVSYERELKGETSLFEDVALLSKAGGNVVVCGCYTNARGVKRKSVVVAEKGKILGVSDMVNRLDGSEYRAGAGIKIYDTAVGKIGIIVAEDLYVPRVAETLSVCGAEFVICIFEELTGNLEATVVRAEAFFYGIPVCLAALGYAMGADIGGKLAFATPASPAFYNFKREQEYHLIETRQRGFYLPKKKGC